MCNELGQLIKNDTDLDSDKDVLEDTNLRAASLRGDVESYERRGRQAARNEAKAEDKWGQEGITFPNRVLTTS